MECECRSGLKAFLEANKKCWLNTEIPPVHGKEENNSEWQIKSNLLLIQTLQEKPSSHLKVEPHNGVISQWNSWSLTSLTMMEKTLPVWLNIWVWHSVGHKRGVSAIDLQAN